MSAIEASGLTKVYRTYKKESGLRGSFKGLLRRKYDETRAADDVSFQIEEGELVGFLGPNGAGKTTVLKILSGLLNPTAGEARVLGFVPWERRNEMKRQFSLVMGQKNALWWDLPAQESLELNRAIYGIDRDRFKKVVGGLSELLEVQDKMNVMVRELSLGERMKMELISALIHEPRVLFLDEPTIGLDVISQKRVREFLRVYNQEHRIVTMLTSHYMQDIEELCHRVIIIDHGKIFFDGPLDDIIDRFSVAKILSLTFAESATRDFSAFGEVLEQTPLSVQLKVPRAKVTETCRQLLDNCKVTDINVQELPVEEVIRQLFGERTTLNQAAAEQARTADRGLAGQKCFLQAQRVGGIDFEGGSWHLLDLHFLIIGNAFGETGRDQTVQRIRYVFRFHVRELLEHGAEDRLCETDRTHDADFTTRELDVTHEFFPSNFHTGIARSFFKGQARAGCFLSSRFETWDNAETSRAPEALRCSRACCCFPASGPLAPCREAEPGGANRRRAIRNTLAG